MRLFQGTWKLPIDEVERSGSFATHLNKAVLLLLKILCEQNDVHSLYHVHLQLSKTPEAGKSVAWILEILNDLFCIR